MAMGCPPAAVIQFFSFAIYDDVFFIVLYMVFHVADFMTFLAPQFFSFGSKNRKLLEMDFFLLPHTYLRSWQTISLEKKI